MGSKQKDSQLVLDQQVWQDFPEKGQVTVHYESVIDNQWPDSNDVQTLKMRHLDYVLVKNGASTQVTILSAMDHTSGEQSWIVNMSAARSPSDWCVELAKAAKLFQEGTLKIDPKTLVTRGSTNPMNFE